MGAGRSRGVGVDTRNYWLVMVDAGEVTRVSRLAPGPPAPAYPRVSLSADRMTVHVIAPDELGAYVEAMRLWALLSPLRTKKEHGDARDDDEQ